jgi:hypothetical protein
MYAAKITWPTARKWVKGTPTKIELPILARVMDALGVDVDQIIMTV